MTFKYKIKSIPTYYNGTQFRSRLEAQWAAFFDLCGWDWDYEPFDLDGWAPDFLLKGKIQALVEVKPVTFKEGSDPAKFDQRLITQARANAGKAFKSSAGNREVIVLGLGPFQCHFGEWALGVFASQNWGSTPDIAVLFEGIGRRLDYAASENSYQYRVGGQQDGDHHLRHIRNDSPKYLWREAQNMTQWKGERNSSARAA